MINTQPSIYPQDFIKVNGQDESNKHVCSSYSAEGAQFLNDQLNNQEKKVYCEACIIQFYHNSNTFLSKLDMSCQQHPKQSSSLLALRGSETINNLNDSLMQIEKDLNISNFYVNCQSNCLERNKQVKQKEEFSQQKSNSCGFQILQENNTHMNELYNNNSTQSINCCQNSIQNINHSKTINYTVNPRSQIPPQQIIQNSTENMSQQNQIHFSASDQLKFGRKQSQLTSNDQLNQARIVNLNQNFVQDFYDIKKQSKKESSSNFPTTHLNYFNQSTEQINISSYLSQVHNLNLQNNNIYPQNTIVNFQSYLINSQNANINIQKQNPLNNLQQNMNNNQLRQLPNQQNQITSRSFTDQININSQNMQLRENDCQNKFNISENSLMNQYICENQKLKFDQNQNQFQGDNDIQNLENSFVIQIQQQIPTQINKFINNQDAITLPFDQIPIYQNKEQIILSQQPNQISIQNKYENMESNKILPKQSSMKKINQKIKHAGKSQRKQQFDIIFENRQTSVSQVNIQYINDEFGYEDENEAEMKIILDHEHQVQLHSKKSKNTNTNASSQLTTVQKLKRKQTKNNQSLAVTKQKGIEKKNISVNKKQKEFLFSSGWCPQTQQIFFEWNNTPLKQISMQSDKIVNESVNVASYVNILSKNRIMIISQNTHSLKYQINLIDLQDNRVICKNQLGQNFQLYPFEPSKLNVQTVKINERLSCIYLMGGSYFKIIKNSTLKNVKRVQQFCIQQILPIHKGRKVVALSLNGLINIYSTTNDRFHLVQQMKIKRESPFNISYVNYFDVDAENSLIYCCVLSSRSQFIQIFNMFTGEIVYSQDIHILQQNYGYNITNMKIFQNHLYIELQLQSDGHHNGEQSVQYKVQAYKIDNESHHLNEFKTYKNSNILKSTISSKQFFLYNSQKSCIIGFEKLNSKKQKHYLSQDSICIADPNQHISSSMTLSPTIKYSYSQQQNYQVGPFGDYDVLQKVFKLNIKQASPNFRPIFTHIFKEIPHGHQQITQKKKKSFIFNTFSSFNQHNQNDSLNSANANQDMVLTLFDQNKNVYKIYQD